MATSSQAPSEQTLESLSAIVDGEASDFECRRLLDGVHTESDVLYSKWHTYHLAGALMRKETSGGIDLSAKISEAIAHEQPLVSEAPVLGAVSGVSDSQPVSANSSVSKKSVGKQNVVSWHDWLAKSAIAASVALAVVVGVQFTQKDDLSSLQPAGQLAASTPSEEPVVSAPSGFDLPTPVARNVSLGSLAEPQTKLQAAAPEHQQFLSNAVIEKELEQLFLEHAELSSENGQFGLMPMARSAKMAKPAE